MSISESPSRSDLATLPAPVVDPFADTGMLPPPDLRVPALAPSALPSLTSAPVVPPIPRFSLDEVDAAITLAADSAVLDGTSPGLGTPGLSAPGLGTPGLSAPGLGTPDLCPPIVESAPALPVLSLAEVVDAAPAEIVQLAKPEDTDAPPLPASPAVSDAPELAVIGPPPSALLPAVEPPVVALPGATPPVVALPAVHAEMLSPANEPLGVPPQVAMVMPSLPTLAGAAPAPASTNADEGPSLHQPSQAGATPMAPLTKVAATPNSATKAASEGSAVRFVARTLAAVVLAGVVGVGAHLGYDWWETRDATAISGVNVDGTDLASWPQVDPPAIRYTDSVTTFSTPAGTRTLTAHREISTGLTQADVVSTDAAGVIVSQTGLDIRGERSFVKPSVDAPWAPAAQADAVALLGDAWTTDVFTVRELFPAEAMPYITVLESVERLLPVKPLQPALALGEAGVVPIAISTEPTSMVWQYRVIIDTEAFRANEAIAFHEWERRIGRSAVSLMEAWVDNTGIVRQITVSVDGTTVTHTLIGGAATSTRFDTDPLLEPGPALAPVEPIAAEVAE